MRKHVEVEIVVRGDVLRDAPTGRASIPALRARLVVAQMP
jgi:hypothetical protein